MRWSMVVISSIAPSAVCIKEIPSLALRMATLKPRDWVSMRVAMFKPAASSLAELMRLPLDKRSIAVDITRLFSLRDCWAVKALTLVLITDMMLLLEGSSLMEDRLSV